MLLTFLVIFCYAALVLAIGLLARGRLSQSPEDFFLAGRRLGGVTLLGTLAATNFSAFTVFGASGAAYRDGLAFFPIMAFGTGFMSLSFWLVGRRVWELGRRHGLVTPAELVGRVYAGQSGRLGLRLIFALVMVAYTVPYLALQPLAGGKVLHCLFGLPEGVGATLVTLLILLYTLRGGLRAVAWTDVAQGLLMLALMALALVVVVGHHGGWATAFGKLVAVEPELFLRPGPRGVYTPQIWFSFLLLWIFCDPMFPQMFQRFYAARSPRLLGLAALGYPAVCTLAFSLPVALGLLGRLEFPGLSGAAADNIVPMLATGLGGDFLGALVLTAGLAALMSTMDSQLLTLGALVTRDLLPGLGQGPFSGRLAVAGLALAGLAVALGVDTTILELGLTAFTGLAALFPTVLFGLILARPRAVSAWTSILLGQAAALGCHFKLLPTFGFLPAVPVIVASVGGYLGVQVATGGLRVEGVSRREAAALAGLGGIFLLAQDYWRWGEAGGIFLSLPTWVWWFMGLSAAQTAVTWWWVRGERGLD